MSVQEVFDEDGRPSILPLLGGLLIVGLLTAYDATVDDSGIVISTVVLSVFFTGALGTPRQTAIVGGVALVAALVSGAWHDNFAEGSYVVRALVVLAGACIAFVAARSRRSSRLVAVRLTTLGAIADAADGTLSLHDTAHRIADVLVPAVADQCVIDTVIGAAGLRRVAVRIAGPHAAADEEFLRARPPSDPEAGFGSMATVTAGRPQLIQADESIARQVARSDEDLAGLLALGVRSMTVVPLTTRGQALGTLTLVATEASGRRFTESDLEFHQICAGRTALALDNAGLDRELRDAERQLGVAIGALDEAVTIMDSTGRTRYANPAAVKLLGFDAPEELYAAQPGEMMELFDVYGEDGEPLALADVPSSALLAGVPDPPPLLVRTVWRSTGESRWLVQRASAIRDERGALIRVVNVIEDVTVMKRSELHARVLAEASEALSSSLDYEVTLQRVADLAVPELADWCAVAMPDGRGFIRTLAVAHSDPEKVQFARELGERYPEPADAPFGTAAVIRDGVTLRLDEIPDDLIAAAAQDAEHERLLRGLGIRGGMTVPLRAAGRTLGALTLVSAESGRHFDDDDQQLAEELGRRAGLAVENARLFTELQSITASLQQGLLPAELPLIPGWATTAHYQPAGALNEVGGDFYDAFETPAGWMVVVGDVTGHGADAARLTAVARFALRAVAQLTGDPIAAIGQLNRMLLAEPELSPVTLVCVLLGPLAEGAVAAQIACCGHPRPLLVAADAVIEVGEIGPIVGAFPELRWRTARVVVRAGETLVLYTDGVTDTRGADEMFGPERLRAALAHAPESLPDLVDHVARTIHEYRVGPQSDDEAVLALRLEPVLMPLANTPIDDAPLRSPADG